MPFPVPARASIRCRVTALQQPAGVQVAVRALALDLSLAAVAPPPRVSPRGERGGQVATLELVIDLSDRGLDEARRPADSLRAAVTREFDRTEESIPGDDVAASDPSRHLFIASETDPPPEEPARRPEENDRQPRDTERTADDRRGVDPALEGEGDQERDREREERREEQRE